MNKYILLVLILVLSIGLPLFLKVINSNNQIPLYEGYSNFTLDETMGKIPQAETNTLVQDIYPSIGKNQISNNTSSSIWKNYPIFELGSYKQMTNNIRHPDNPDEGTCMPASMCGALYKDKNTGSNVVDPLPPVIIQDNGTRVNYYGTKTNNYDTI
jgi:hypothetical protein